MMCWFACQLLNENVAKVLQTAPLHVRAAQSLHVVAKVACMHQLGESL